MLKTTIKTLGLLFLFINQVSAQLLCSEPSYRDFSLNVLANLDKSQIPHQTLYDAVYPFADLEGFTGNIDADTSNGLHFMQAYNELYYSRTFNVGYQHPSELYSNVKNIPLNQEFYHQIGIIDYQYLALRHVPIGHDEARYFRICNPNKLNLFLN